MFKQTNKIKLASVGLVLLMSSGIANATPLVTNGDFGSGSLGWTVVGDNSYFNIGSPNTWQNNAYSQTGAADVTARAIADAVAGGATYEDAAVDPNNITTANSFPDSISQLIDTTVGHTYLLTFIYKITGDALVEGHDPASFNVDWGTNHSLGTVSTVTQSNPLGWLTGVFDWTATQSSTVLSFSSTNDSDFGYNYLANVQLVDQGNLSNTNNVPEPESLVMMMLGLPMVVWAARRRKGKFSRLC